MMKKMMIAASALAFVFAGAGLANADVDAGKIFKKRCKMCHAFDHKKVGPAFKDMNKDEKVLKTTITNGRKMMPKWKGKLSPEEIDAMVAFIKSKQ